MKDVFLGLGSNTGDRIENLRAALAALAPHFSIQKQSSVYESAPYGVAEEQPMYLNMVVSGETMLTPMGLLGAVKGIEQQLGRAPDTHNLPRPIDIDILLYGETVDTTPELTIPHRGMHERAFVLVPLDEIASFHFHPTRRVPVADLLDALGAHDHLIWRSDAQL